jgi:hypothetical protein
VGEVAVIAAAVVGRSVASQLPGDGRRRSAQPPGDLSDAVTALAQCGDALAFKARQIPPGLLGLGQPGRRHTAVLSAPPEPGLAADTQMSTSLNSAHTGGK